MTASGTRLASCELRRASPRIGGPDQHLDYGVVVTAMAVAKDAGVSKVMMLTDPTATLNLGELDAAK